MISSDVLRLVRSLPEPVLLVGRNGDIVAFNNRAKALLCGNHSEVASTLQDLIAEPPTQVLRYLQACVRTGEALPGAFTLKFQDGGRCRFEGTRVKPGSNENVAFVWLRIVRQEHANSRFLLLNERIAQLAKEVHARTRAEHALRGRTAQFETLLNEAPLGVYLVDWDLRIRHMNPQALAMFGTEDVVGRNLDEVLHHLWAKNLADAAVLRFRHTLLTGELYISWDTTEMRLDRGTRECYEWQVNRIPLSAERHGLVCYFRDITARKLADEALRRSEKLAATGRLASSIAHEINNPLEAVTNLLYLTRQDSGLAPESRKYLIMADQELTRVAHLAKQTLGFYRDTSAPAWLKVPDLLESVVSMYSHKLALRKVELRKDFRDVPEIFALAGEFRQVLSNLLMNALDASPREGARLVLRTFPSHDWRETGREGVRVSVMDNGCGISKDKIPKIFDAFFTTKKDTGTGLGLWLSQEIVRKHGGRIQVRSRTTPPQCGTAFSVFWPCTGEALPESRVAP